MSSFPPESIAHLNIPPGIAGGGRSRPETLRRS
jgi:hypothetical protein